MRVERNGELLGTVSRSLSSVSTALFQLCKSLQCSVQSKFLSIHAPSCVQAGTESGLEINASVNGFALPLRFASRGQTAPLWYRARVPNGRGNNPDSPRFLYESGFQIQPQVSCICLAVFSDEKTISRSSLHHPNKSSDFKR